MGPWTLILVFQGVIGPSRALTTVQIPGFSTESIAKTAGFNLKDQVQIRVFWCGQLLRSGSEVIHAPATENTPVERTFGGRFYLSKEGDEKYEARERNAIPNKRPEGMLSYKRNHKMNCTESYRECRERSDSKGYPFNSSMR